MSHLRITDNQEIELSKINGFSSEPDLDNLRLISNVRISSLSIADNNNLLIFPKSLNQYGDNISESYILSLYDNKIKTGNIMGFVGVNETQLTISSRFDENGNDYFMHYMLQRVFSINLFDMKHSTSADSIFDFLIYLFPYYLKKALAQGLFKKYRRFEHNDANVKGTINVTQHIRQNTPFRGTVAYTTREHSYDNEVTQLVRHTIEYIRLKEVGKTILTNDAETKNCVSQIVMATPFYSNQKRVQIINQNLRPVRHPYFSEYTALQKLCLQILRHETIKFGKDKDKVYGVLFDGAWLWEEYLAIVLEKEYNHYRKDTGKRFYLFEKNIQQIIPDYLSKDKQIVADAKYIPLNKGNNYGEEKANAIYYKTITYMYRFCSKKGFLFFPYPDREVEPISLTIITEASGINGGTITKLGLRIPSNCQNFHDFIDKMKSNEEDFIKKIRE